jgi:hypothetical protein
MTDRLIRNEYVLQEKAERGKGTYFDYLKGCFGNTRISPTDMDCVIERRGKFLFIEEKNPEEDITVGQRILLEQLAKKPGITCVVMWGKSKENHVEAYQVHDGMRWGKKIPCTTEEFRDFVSNWFKSVNKWH